MLELVKTFDLLGSITQFLQERRHSAGISGKPQSLVVTS